MKLLFCKKCQDVVKLGRIHKTCQCGRVGGRFIDGLKAVYTGAKWAVPLSVDDESLLKAITNRPTGDGRGEQMAKFGTFVVPENCPTMKEYDRVEYLRTKQRILS